MPCRSPAAFPTGNVRLLAAECSPAAHPRRSACGSISVGQRPSTRRWPHRRGHSGGRRPAAHWRPTAAASPTGGVRSHAGGLLAAASPVRRATSGRSPATHSRRPLRRRCPAARNMARLPAALSKRPVRRATTAARLYPARCCFSGGRRPGACRMPARGSVSDGPRSFAPFAGGSIVATSPASDILPLALGPLAAASQSGAVRPVAGGPQRHTLRWETSGCSPVVGSGQPLRSSGGRPVARRRPTRSGILFVRCRLSCERRWPPAGGPLAAASAASDVRPFARVRS